MLPTPHAVGTGPVRSSRTVVSQPPSSVAGACRIVICIPWPARTAGPPDPPVHSVDFARTVDQQDAAMPEAGDMVDEQADRTRLVHHHVVAAVPGRAG